MENFPKSRGVMNPYLDYLQWKVSYNYKKRVPNPKTWHSFEFKIKRKRFYLLRFSSMAACAAATRAIGTRKGEQDT